MKRDIERNMFFTIACLCIIAMPVIILIYEAKDTKKFNVFYELKREMDGANGQIQEALHNYSNDNQRYPESIQELVTSGYMDAMPVCPYTGREFVEIDDLWDVQAGTIFYEVKQAGDDQYVRMQVFGITDGFYKYGAFNEWGSIATWLKHDEGYLQFSDTKPVGQDRNQ